MRKRSTCCLECTHRAVGCHGKNPDGTWKCEAWGKRQQEQKRKKEWRAVRKVPAKYRSENKRRLLAKQQRKDSYG